MSWIQRVSSYQKYVATNYVSRIGTNHFCHKSLQKEIDNIVKHPRIIPSVLFGKEYPGEITKIHHSPSYDKPIIYQYGYLDKTHYSSFDNFHEAKRRWKNTPVDEKFNLFEKIADLVTGKYYYPMIAATMVGQGKNLVEAELDAIAETVDFLNFNIEYASRIYQKQPLGLINYSQYLPLQGVVSAITPFNFTAIAANLSTAPLYFGNTVFWKPSEKSLLSNYLFYEICLEAGMPPDILHFVIMEPEHFVNEIVREKSGGVLFTGSTSIFQDIIKKIDYTNHFPRVIGETGGKNFHFVEKTADLDLVVEKTYQSAYGYSGQKCSACSVLYLPDSLMDDFMEKFKKYHNDIHPDEQNRYCVIGGDSYQNAVKAIDSVNDNQQLECLMGGNYNNQHGYYVEPTLLKVDGYDPLMEKELFAPILIVKNYDPNDTLSALEKCAHNSKYKLTGALFSRNSEFINYAAEYLDGSCGNFYINDKSTGSVVGQQPFGGFGHSGTNDKAGDINFMMRLFSQRNIKQCMG